jgi:hypothetical protein
MYLQVSKELCNDTEWCWAGVGEPLQMFAKLVAAKALAQRTEPVADDFFKMIADRNPKPFSTPQRTWVGLTDKEIDSYFEDHGWSPSEYYYPVIKDIEAKLK